MSPSPKEIVIKEMVADISIDFMFLPPPLPHAQPLDPLLPAIAPTQYLNFFFENLKKSIALSMISMSKSNLTFTMQILTGILTW